MRTFNSVTSFLTRAGSIAFFWWALDVFSKVFDYGIYTAVVAYYGLITGGVIMLIASFVLDVSLVYIYSYFKKDLFGFETINEWREYEGGSLIKQLRRKIFKMSDVIVYIVITFVANPFLATAYLRKTDNGRYGMNRRDWLLFMPSFIIGNLFWILISDKVAPITKAFWHSLWQVVTFQA